MVDRLIEYIRFRLYVIICITKQSKENGNIIVLQFFIKKNVIVKKKKS